MKRSVRERVDAIYDGLEWLFNNMDSLTKEEVVDVCARLRSANNKFFGGTSGLDEELKARIKKYLKDKPGALNGEAFVATYAFCDTKRLNQKRLKEERPSIYNEYNEDAINKTITFSAR